MSGTAFTGAAVEAAALLPVLKQCVLCVCVAGATVLVLSTKLLVCMNVTV